MAVDEGVPDGGRHPNVGLLGFDEDGSGPAPAAFLCSGSVLSDSRFLTAAHCIAAVAPDVEWVVTLAPGDPAEPVVRPGLFPDDFPFPLVAPAVRGGVAVTHPDFDPETRAHDVAVVRFPPGAFAGSTPVTLPAAKHLDRMRRRGALKHSRFRLVGYGADPERGDGAPVFVVEGYRQTATAPFRALERGHRNPRRPRARHRPGLAVLRRLGLTAVRRELERRGLGVLGARGRLQRSAGRPAPRPQARAGVPLSRFVAIP